MLLRLFWPFPDIDMNLQWTNNLYNLHHNMQQASVLELRLTKIIAACGQYRQKMEQLFSNREGTVSPTHMKRGIVINPRSLFNLLESNFLLELKSTSRENYYQLKTEVLSFISFLIEDFPLNAKFFYEEPSLSVQGNRTLNLITYLIREAKESFLWMKQQAESTKAKPLFQAYHTVSAQIFYQVCSVCTLRTSQLKQITNTLTDFYYQQKLYTKLIGTCFRLLDAGLQQRNITPFLYFVGNHPNDSVRVLYGNNKWHFAKGMTVFLWISTLRRSDCRIFLLSADDGSEIVIRLQGEALVVQSGKGEKKERKVVGQINMSLNSPTMIGIELEPSSATSFFKNSSFKLNIKINGVQYLNAAPIPSFEKSQFIVQFSLLSNFIGKLYAAIVTARAQLCQWQQVSRVSQYGVCRQSLVWDFLSQEVLRTESILCIFNSQRSFQGLLLNYVGSMNHACFQGKVSEVKYHKYDSKVVDIYLPFLYMLTLIKDRDAEWKQLFDLLFQHLLQIIGRENYETDTVMLLLYFLELNNYEISQSTLNCLYYHANDHTNFYLNFVLKYLDVHALIQQGLKIDENISPFEDPVQKSILMFHLQTLWKEKWNAFQGFQGWWSPHFFSSQNDAPFDPRHFIYNPTRESRVEWSVMNLVTKDSCKCFVEPVFLIPQYGQSSRYQQEYLRKECFNEYFRVNLSRRPKNQKLVCVKAAASSFDRIKSKLLGTAELLAPLKKEKSQIKQFASQCLFVDILTVVQGQIMVDRSGFIIFSSAHRSRSFDHMCIKAFKNETFYYLNVPFCDVRKVYRKRFNASPNAVYIKTKDGREMMFHFYRKNAQAFLSVLQGHVKVKRDSFNNYLTSQQPLLWIDKKLSNYEYLQWLNQIAGRNYNDIAQYPVLPWVFVANSLDQSHQYRDLSRNMGSHGDAERVQRFKQKYQQQNEEQLFSEYHFGTHYSSSAIIFNYLIRIRPYSIGALTLQSGHFDCADRIFYNYCGSWHNATTSPTDIRQLIPQIYTLPQMFINRNNYEYGLTQDKIPVDNVILPEWAKGDPFRFVARLRKELESAYVCEHIQQWVDLVYGYKQRGKEAVEHMNIFYPLTYENCIDLDKVKDPDERLSFETQIAHFGQNPAQIIGNSPHPSRRAVKAHWQGKLLADGGEVTIQKCFLSKASLKQEKFLFKSVFEGRNSVLAIRFISQQLFLVLRKHEYHIFRILNKKDDFLSRQQTVSYESESCSTSFNYKELTTFVPVAAISDEILLIGGFYNGHVQVLFLKQPKFNQSFKFPGNTVTGMAFERAFQMLYLGDQEGYLRIYRVYIHQKQIQFQHLQSIKAHDSKINSVTAHYKANLLCTCSQDGTLNLYNLYSHHIIRTIHHPLRLPMHFAKISTTPLYSIVFYSRENSTIYVYSINGQYLDSIQDKSGFIYNPSILKGTDSTECLVYLNSYRELFIWEMPFLQLRRKVKVKRDDFRISCFETCLSGKIAINGTEDGALQIITNPAAY